MYQQLMPPVCDNAHHGARLSPRNGGSLPSPVQKGAPKHGAILEAEMESPEQARREGFEFKLFGNMTSLMKKLHPGKTPEEMLTVWTLDDMTLGWKFCCILFAALPRFTITMLCGYIGAIYIGRSESKEAMLLNTLAVLFVLDIDDSIYQVFTSGSLKVHMENVKPVILHPTNNERLVTFVFASFIFPVLVALLSYWIVEMDMDNELSMDWLGKLGVGHLLHYDDE
jgi:hypothetical protein